MEKIIEGAPEELLEKPVDTPAVATNAKEALVNFKEAGSKEFSTVALSDLKFYLRTLDLNDKTEEQKLKEAFLETGFLKADEKQTVEDKVVDIVGMLDEFISKPGDYKVKYPSNHNMLINLCEVLSK